MIDALVPLLSLIALEVILGIDNIIFISILADKLPENQRNKLRYWGLGLAMVMRLCLLAVIAWILKLDTTLFTLFNIGFSGKGLILLFGGLIPDLYKVPKKFTIKRKWTNSADEPSIPKQGQFYEVAVGSHRAGSGLFH